MKEAAMPIIAMESPRPKIKIIGCSRAACHGQNVVERHGNVGHDNLPTRLSECFARFAACNCSIGPHRTLWPCGGCAQLSPHFPTHPQQQDPASKQEADDLEDCVANPASKRRSIVAAAIPIKIALPRCASGSPAEARPMTMALSPASTRSIRTICKNTLRTSVSK